jgi:hypothetical protein
MRKKPMKDYPTPPQAWGIHPPGALALALRQSKDPSIDPFRITRGLRGYYQVPIVEYPKKGN